MSNASAASREIKVFEHVNYSTDHRAPFCSTEGDVLSAPAVDAAYELWALRTRLAAGASITWAPGHGEEGIYVISGGVTTGDGSAYAGDLVVLESGAHCTLTATEDTEVLHVGSTPPPACNAEGAVAGVRLLPAGEPTAEFAAGGGVTMGVKIFVDGTSPTCGLNFLRTWSNGPTNAPAHSHSHDEMIHVLTGALRVGPITASAGSTIAIPAGRFYAFRTDEAFSFVNYRRELSWIKMGSDGEPEPETIEWTVRSAARAGLQA